jgi:hypothetical protein
MSKEVAEEWVALGEQLAELNPEKHREVLDGMRDLVEAQRIIARFDWQLMFRGRPRKRYHA